MSELKPCPFCGNESQYLQIGGKWKAGCVTCDIEFSPDNWNTRANLAGPQWRPIDTAPRDGTMIIVGYALDGEVLEISQAQWVDEFFGCEGLHGEWYDIDGIMDQDDVNVWMPLPKPNNL